MIVEKLRQLVVEALEALTFEATDIRFEHPSNPAFGDYSTNIALALAKNTLKAPHEIAKLIVAEISRRGAGDAVSKIEVAGAGFINFFLSGKFFESELKRVLEAPDRYGSLNTLVGTKTIVEYTDPNPFKEFHVGHLMANTIGESISRLVEFAGAETRRACYQGDVGLHVAKALYAALVLRPESVSDWGKAYTHGAKQYEASEDAKKEILEINKKVFARSDESLNALYNEGRRITLEYFEHLYKRLGTYHNRAEGMAFDFYFFESQTSGFGKQLVEEYLERGVFKRSEGAVIFPGEEHGLHTRVFITKEGLPTYEAKELGLAKKKYDVYPYDLSIIVTGNEVNDYFKVLLTAMRLIFPDLTKRTRHISHGMLRLPSGKMSSRSGSVITAESLLDEVETLVRQKIAERELMDHERNKIASDVAVGAVKYWILRQSVGGDIVFDLEQSISFEGDSGPYLQYAYTRAHSLLEKAKSEALEASAENAPLEIPLLVRFLPRFPEVVKRSLEEFHPHYLALYLTELAALFNSFYAAVRIVDRQDPYSPYYVALAEAFAAVMKNGLWLLGIEAPKKM